LTRAFTRLLTPTDCSRNNNWSSLDLTEVVHTVLKPFPGRFEASGPPVALTPQQVQNLSLTIHELATNAAKHGALSAANRNIVIRWTASGEGISIFKWQEQGGPAVALPARQGFGTTLIKATFPDAILDYAPTGMCCVVKLVFGTTGQAA
jgi:two-component sensor histidine kinase